MEYTSIESDDMLTTLLVSNVRKKTLQLYAVKWMFDTSQLD